MLFAKREGASADEDGEVGSTERWIFVFNLRAWLRTRAQPAPSLLMLRVGGEAPAHGEHKPPAKAKDQLLPLILCEGGGAR